MLKISDNPEEPVPAAQMRVKTEELAQAIAAIEFRRQRETEAKQGTVIIGEAIKELQLEITPEEILAEVESMHVRQEETSK